MKVSTTLGGLAGAIALTLVNESMKKVNSNAPRLDLLGQNALAKLLKGNDMISKSAEKIFPLAGDLVSNTLYYGMARGGNPSNTYLRGAMLGLGAGLGAITLPEQMGLDKNYTSRTNQTKAMTVAWYIIGGLVAAAVINALDKYNDTPPDDLKNTAVKKTKTAAKNVIKQITETV